MRYLALVPLLLLTAAAPAGDELSFMVSGFERVRVEGPYEVRVVTGAPFSARAEGSPAALRRVTLRVDGTTLVVAAGNDNIRNTPLSPVVVTVAVPNALRAALVNGAGRLTIDRVKGLHVDLGVNGAGSLNIGAVDADDLAATLTGTGEMTLGGNAGRATFSSFGAGSVEASALVVRDLVVRASSSGNANFTARYSARINSIGVGSLRVSGRPQCLVSGSGPVSCGDAAGQQ